LNAGEIDEPSVEWVTLHPPPGRVISGLLVDLEDPASLAPPGLIDAEHAVGAGSTSTSAAATRTARCAVGQLTPCAAPASLTDRHAPPTAAPIARRNRPVVRIPAGTSLIVSVKDPRGHPRSKQRHRTLCQAMDNPVSPRGKSFGVVVGRCFTEQENTPQSGHAPAL